MGATRRTAREAARVAGFDAANQARTSENPSIVAPLLLDRLERILATDPAYKRTRLTEEGAPLNDDEVFKLAFGNAA